MFHQLLKIFVDAETNKDGLVSRDDLLISLAAALPRAFGYAFTDSAEQQNNAAIISMIDFQSLRKFNESLDAIVKHEAFITWDEWIKFCKEHIKAEAEDRVPRLP